MAQLADKVLAFTSFMVAGASSIGKAFATIISAASTYAGVFIGMIKSIVEGYRTIWKIIGKDDNILVEYADKAIAGLDSVQTGLADMARGADKSGESIEDFALLADSALTRVRNAMSAAGHGAVELGENFDSAGKALDKFWGEDDLKALKASVAEGLKIYDHNLSEREKAEQLYASKIEEMRAGQSEYAIALDKKMAASADKLAKSREQSMQKYATIATGLLTSVIDDAMSGEKSFGQIMAGVASRSMQIIIQQVQASVMARMIDAMANAASSQAMIPFIGPILAVAAVGAMGSLFAGLLGKIASPPKFHSGGVVPGSPSQERLVLARGQERFGGHVEQAHVSGPDPGHVLLVFLRRQRTVQEKGRDPGGAQLFHLVLHQRDERRHDQSQPGQNESRSLKAERLPTAGGKDDERVAAGKGTLHRLALEREKAGVAPMLAQDFDDALHPVTPDGESYRLSAGA